MPVTAKNWAAKNRDETPAPAGVQVGRLEWKLPFDENTELSTNRVWESRCQRFRAVYSTNRFGMEPRFLVLARRDVVQSSGETRSYWEWTECAKGGGNYPREYKTLGDALAAAEAQCCKVDGLIGVESNAEETVARAENCSGLTRKKTYTTTTAGVADNTPNPEENMATKTKEKTAVTVTEADAKQLLIEIGLHAVPGYSTAKVESKLNELSEYEEDEMRAKVKKAGDTLETVLAAFAAGNTVTVTGGKKAKAAKAPKAEADGAAASNGNGKAKKAPKEPKEKTERAPRAGVISAIVDVLKDASAKRPVSKEQILEALVKQFPDRAPEAMAKTVSAQVGYHLVHLKGLDVQSKKTDAGKVYWLA